MWCAVKIAFGGKQKIQLNSCKTFLKPSLYMYVQYQNNIRLWNQSFLFTSPYTFLWPRPYLSFTLSLPLFYPSPTPLLPFFYPALTQVLMSFEIYLIKTNCFGFQPNSPPTLLKFEGGEGLGIWGRGEGREGGNLFVKYFIILIRRKILYDFSRKFFGRALA